MPRMPNPVSCQLHGTAIKDCQQNHNSFKSNTHWNRGTQEAAISKRSTETLEKEKKERKKKNSMWWSVLEIIK